MSTKRKKTNATSRTGINWIRSLIEKNNDIFQEIDLENDVGNDAYIEFVINEETTGCCIASQIKTGKSYINTSGEYFFQSDKEHFEYWSSHLLPICGLVHNPENNTTKWIDITEYLNENPHIIKNGPYNLKCTNEFSETSFKNFKEHFLEYKNKMDHSFVKSLDIILENNSIPSIYPQKIYQKIPKAKLLKKKDTKSKISGTENWYIFEPHECSSEEQHFVDFIKTVIPDLQNLYQDIKLIRNEKSFEIFSFDKERDGARFEPDFILLLKDREKTIHQVFCEPKGNWTKDKKDKFDLSSEKWKNDLLNDITKCTKQNLISLEDINENGLKLYENNSYKILGLPFYNFEEEEYFKNNFRELLL